VFCERAHYVLEGDVRGPVRWTVEGDGGAFTGSGSVEGADLLRARESAGLPTRNPDVAFVTAVAAGTPASPDLAEALPAHRAAEAAYRSAAAGGTPEAP
jgi:predicted dehydrogenase